MIRENICFYVHTEYHLLLTLHAVSTKYTDKTKYEVHLIINQNPGSKRLSQELDFTGLPYTVKYTQFPKNGSKNLTEEQRSDLKYISGLKPREFNFFQEQDAVAVILISELKKLGTKINLYQDGLKPYIAHTMKFSPSLYLNNVKQNLWIKRNGYRVLDHLSFRNCKMYGFLKGIDSLHLTFPDAYINWNRLPLVEISPQFTDDFVSLLKKVYRWDDALLQHREGVIFYLNQPMHDDGSFELNMLSRLRKLYPEARIYIKNHPLTPESKIAMYQQLENVSVISSKIPAELFISQLQNSIVLSVGSTSMFINNSNCKFYYTYGITEKNNIERLKKYSMINPAKHVTACKTIEEIQF